jgi:hypothetical protein
MQDFRLETKVESDGSLTIKDLPFSAGDNVEVIIRGRKAGTDQKKRYPLRGTPIRYLDPVGSVAEEDWEALR